MFKSLSQKSALLFSLSFAVIFSLMLFAWAAVTANGSRNAFSNSVHTVFTEESVREVSEYIKEAHEVNAGSPPVDNAKYVFDSYMKYSTVLGLDFERSFSVIDESANVLYSSDIETAKVSERTASIASAMIGKAKTDVSLFKSYCDFAQPFYEDDGKILIAYVHDSDAFMFRDAGLLLMIGLVFFAVGIILAFVLGLKLSRDVTVPIKQLSRSARRLADGDIHTIKLIGAETELKDLSQTIMSLASTLEETNTKAKREQNKLETILQNMTDGILAFDLRGRLIHINHEARRLLNRNYLENANFDTLFMELKANISMGDLLYINHDDETLERQVTTENDVVIKMSFTTFNQDNKISGIVVVLRDITNQEKLEKARRNFVADVSHELRTPLTTIKSYSETLMDSPDADHELSSKFLNVISSEADRMVRIISDLLTLSKLDAKHAVYKEPEAIDVRKMLEAITDRLQLSAKKKEQTLIYSPINEVPVILGDRDSLERVIINIVGNALKYTPDGGRIDVFSSKVYNDICIKVVDNGIGISAESLPHIFDRFYRVDKARSRDKGGTGLGLAIAKQTIETAFNGKIMIQSEHLKGTEVIITIPVPTK